MHTFAQPVSVITLAVFVLCGCAPLELSQTAITSQGVANSNVASVVASPPQLSNVRGSAAMLQQGMVQQQTQAVYRKAKAPYIGATMVPATNEDKLPTLFFEPFNLDFSGDKSGTTLGVAMARLSKLTGVPIRINPDVYSRTTATPPNTAQLPPQGQQPQPQQPQVGQALLPSLTSLPAANASARTKSPTPTAEPSPTGNKGSVFAAQAVSLDAVDMKCESTLAACLTHLTDKLGLSWDYRDGAITVSRYVIEMHEVFVLPGAQSFTFNSAGTTSSGKGASSNLSVTDTGKTAPTDTIEKTISQMMVDVPGSSLVHTDGSGRIMVKTSKEMQSRIREFVRGENSALRRQAQIQFDIYIVNTDIADNRGINWTSIIEKAGAAAQLKLNAAISVPTTSAGTASLNILAGNGLSQVLGDSSVMLQALHTNGFTAQHRPVSLLALNRQWGMLSRTATDFYLAETTPAAANNNGIGGPGLKTD